MINGLPTAEFTIMERLQKLREYSRRYCESLFIMDSDEDLGRRSANSDSNGYTDQERLLPVPFSVESVVFYEFLDSPSRSLAVYAPPSLIENVDARCWTVRLSWPIKLTPVVLAVDVTQGLVVLARISHNDKCVSYAIVFLYTPVD